MELHEEEEEDEEKDLSTLKRKYTTASASSDRTTASVRFRPTEHSLELELVEGIWLNGWGMNAVSERLLNIK